MSNWRNGFHCIYKYRTWIPLFKYGWNNLIEYFISYITSSIKIEKLLRICLPLNFVSKNSFVLHKDWVVTSILRSFLCFMTLRFVHSEEGWLSKFSFNLNSSFDKNIFGAQKTISVLVIFSRKVGSEK